MKVQRNQIERRSKSQLAVRKHLDRFRMNRSVVCGFFQSGTCTAGDECLLLHTYPRNSKAHGDPGAHKEVGSGGFASVKQNKDGGEVPGWWYQRGFGSSELLGGSWGFDGKKGWGAGIGRGEANAVGLCGRANDGVSSWGKGNYSGAWGSQNNYAAGVNWGSWDFDSKSEETTNTCDAAWGYKPEAEERQVPLGEP